METILTWIGLAIGLTGYGAHNTTTITAGVFFVSIALCLYLVDA